MAAPALRTKTDAELRFYTENPSLYQAELVVSAQRELRRRGLRPVAAAPEAPIPYADYEAEPANRPPLALLAALVVIVALAAFSFCSWQRKAVASAPPPLPSALSPDSLKLETVATHALPTFNNDQNVDQELTLIPAAELKNPQKRNQFRELTRRFWRAQNPSAYLIRQSSQVLSYPIYAGHLQLVHDQWNYLNKGLVYRYDLPPTMADHLLRIRVISRIQLAAIQELQRACTAQRSLALSRHTQLNQDTVQHLLPALQHHVVLRAR